MGEINIIARRLSDKYIEYGYCGGGTFAHTGLRIMTWYSKRKMKEYPQYEDIIDYLFSLGETKLIGMPGSENGGQKRLLSHDLYDRPYAVGVTERLMFSQYAFNDHGYFFDSDEKWYYIIPGPFRIKIPIELIYNNLDDEDYEFGFRNKVVIQLMTYIFQDYKNEKFNKLINELNLDKKNLLAEIVNAEFPAAFLWEHYRYVYNFFDDWVVVKANPSFTEVEKFIIREKSEKHIETIFWQ